MKTNILHTAVLALFTMSSMTAQDVTTVRANSTDISDNLDLKAVASIFGDSSDLEDFERRLNDPNTMISNLDLNGDNRVDYLRVVELSESNTHVIVLQAVLAVDTFQDVATIEVERDSRNNVTVQVVGDVYMYGPNYIYQPVYVAPPVMFNIFWVSNYRPYYSPWYWGYYPRYYSYWAPCAPYRYHNHVYGYINTRNTYAYVNTRHSHRAGTIYGSRRNNAYERQHPNTGFSSRNHNIANRRDLEQSRGNTFPGGRTRGVAGVRNGSTPASNSRGGFQNSSRSNSEGSRTLSDNNTRGGNYQSGRSLNNGNGTQVNNNGGRNNGNSNTRSNNSQPAIAAPAPRSNSNEVRSNAGFNNSSNVRSNSNNPVRNTAPVQSNNTPRNTAPAPRQSAPAMQSPAPRQSAPSMQSPAPARQQSAPAMQGGGSGRGNGGGGNAGGRSNSGGGRRG